MKIIFEDKDVIVINKPSGLAVQSANIMQKDCVTLLKEHLKRENPNIKGEPYIGVVHRLDQPVAGLVVFGKNQKAAAKLSAQVGSNAGMNKIYHAVVQGIMPCEDNVELKNLIIKDSKDKKAIIVNAAGKGNVQSKDSPKEAILNYSVISTDEVHNTTSLRIELKTGRFHQIRAQLSNIGHPIIGDRKYGATLECDGSSIGINNTKGAIALQACELTFTHPSNGKIMKFIV